MEIVKRAIRLMHEGKCIYDQFQLDEDYNVPDAKEDVGNVIEGTVCVPSITFPTSSFASGTL